MLTCQTVGVKKAWDYFRKGFELESNSRWWGKAALRLNLEGAVSDSLVFGRILKGYSKSGRKKLAAKKIDLNKRRAAIDCVFSAPKSVSLQALVGGDEQVRAAHRIAVEKTLALIEQRYSHTRMRQGNKGRLTITTGNLVVALFDHIEARSVAVNKSGEKLALPDPHLHTHCLIMNMTEVEPGKWYSHLNEAIYRERKFLGMVYQHNLALQLQQLGYQVISVGNGQFELVGFEPHHLQYFSKRRQKILLQTGVNGTQRERELAWRITRAWKKSIVPEQLLSHWQLEAQQLGIKFLVPGEIVPLSPREIDLKVINEAIAHCSQRAVAFLEKDIEQFILEQGIPSELSLISSAVTVHPELIKLSQSDGVRYTTGSALHRELATIRLMQSGQGTEESIEAPANIQVHLSGQSLTRGQWEALTTALTSKDKVLAWQGVPGTEKTCALNKFKQIAQSKGYRVKGFAPTVRAASVLEEEVGIEAYTVATLLSNQLPAQTKAKQIWIVDSAELLSADAAYNLLARATAENARVLLLKNTRRTKVLQTENFFKSLQLAGMTVVNQNLSKGQKAPLPQYQQVGHLFAQGQWGRGLTLLAHSGCIKEIKNSNVVVSIVDDYLSLAPEQRDKTLILAGTHDEKLEITQEIRSRLFVNGVLGKSSPITSLKAKEGTKVQMRYTHHFQIGDAVMPLKNYKKRNLQKGKLYTVVEKTTDTLTLSDCEGNKCTVDPSFEKAVYNQKAINIAEGDLLCWTKNERQLGHKKGQRFRVVSLDNQTAIIKYLDGTDQKIDLTTPLHLDYAISTTSYSRTNKIVERVLISADSTLGSDSFYAAVSKVSHELKLYTKNKHELLNRACLSPTKENSSARERGALFTETLSVSVQGSEPLLNVAVDKIGETSTDSPTTEIQVKNPKTGSVPFYSKKQQFTENQEQLPLTQLEQIKADTEALAPRNPEDLTYVERLSKYLDLLPNLSLYSEKSEKSQEVAPQKIETEQDLEK